jgi:hypothetical protein
MHVLNKDLIKFSKMINSVIPLKCITHHLKPYICLHNLILFVLQNRNQNIAAVRIQSIINNNNTTAKTTKHKNIKLCMIMHVLNKDLIKFKMNEEHLTA